MLDNHKILLVGCGKMGGAILEGMIKAGVLARNIVVIEPNTEATPDLNIKILKHFDKYELDGFTPDTIILAVKPQIAAEVLADYKIFASHSLFISIIAGKTISFFEKHLGSNAAIIRTMPNLPIVVGKGMAVMYANKNATPEQKDLGALFFSLQKSITLWTEDEADLDAVTAISGSGPAYIFHFIECLTDAGIKLGLEINMAKTLAIQTVYGSAVLALKSDKSASELREAVTSPKGTTEAALKILMDSEKMNKLIVEATSAAYLRSKELSE